MRRVVDVGVREMETRARFKQQQIAPNAALVAVGRYEEISLARFSGPLPLNQSLLMIFPQIVFLVAILVVCFSISYVVFMRREIRSL